MSAPVRKRLKPIPKFRSEDEEREFWATHDTCDYIPWEKAYWASAPDLKPSTRTISVRLPEHLIAQLKILANRRDVPYQSLLKIYLAERVEQELRAEPSGVAESRAPYHAGGKRPGPRPGAEARTKAGTKQGKRARRG